MSNLINRNLIAFDINELGIRAKDVKAETLNGNCVKYQTMQ